MYDDKSINTVTAMITRMKMMMPLDLLMRFMQHGDEQNDVFRWLHSAPV